MPVDKICDFCGKVYIVRNRRFCSRSCAAKSHISTSSTQAKCLITQLRERYPGRYIKVEVACSQCGITFRINASLVGRVKTCSKACSRLRKRAPQPISYRQSLVNGQTVSEHLRIARERLGVDVMRGKQVHHINGKRADNRLENLVVLSRSAHYSIHWIERKTGVLIGADAIRERFENALFLAD